jgi:hypothetical protein
MNVDENQEINQEQSQIQGHFWYRFTNYQFFSPKYLPEEVGDSAWTPKIWQKSDQN